VAHNLLLRPLNERTSEGSFTVLLVKASVQGN
jgi:hypothetical protein